MNRVAVPKMSDEQLAAAYRWEIEFESGQLIREGQRPLVNPNKLPAELGRPIRISLVPQLPNRQTIDVRIPIGAAPVVHKLIARGSASQRLLALTPRVGFRIGRIRSMRAVDPTTGKSWDITDEKGRPD